MDNDIEKKWLISCRDAGLGYENKAVLEHLNIEILEGQYICVIGENGSGKSTLIKSLLGLLKPVSGTVQINRQVGKGLWDICRADTDTEKLSGECDGSSPVRIFK